MGHRGRPLSHHPYGLLDGSVLKIKLKIASAPWCIEGGADHCIESGPRETHLLEIVANELSAMISLSSSKARFGTGLGSLQRLMLDLPEAVQRTPSSAVTILFIPSPTSTEASRAIVMQVPSETSAHPSTSTLHTIPDLSPE